MTHESLSPEGCVRLSTARPVHAKQGNLLLLIALLHLLLVQGWVLLAGTFYLSPFLCSSLLFLDACCLLLCAFTSGFHIPRRMSLPSPFCPLCSSLSLHFFPYPAVFPSGCCSSALELSCWKCQNLAFSPCRVAWCSSSPQCTFCLFTGIVLALTFSWWMLYMCWMDTSASH